MGTKSVSSPVTKSSNGFGHTNPDYSRTHKIEKTRKNGFGPFSYKFFVCITVGLSEKNPVCRDQTHVPTCQRLHGTSELPGRPAVYGQHIQQSMVQPVMVANPGRGQLKRENDFFPVPIRT